MGAGPPPGAPPPPPPRPPRPGAPGPGAPPPRGPGRGPRGAGREGGEARALEPARDRVADGGEPGDGRIAEQEPDVQEDARVDEEEDERRRAQRLPRRDRPPQEARAEVDADRQRRPDDRRASPGKGSVEGRGEEDDGIASPERDEPRRQEPVEEKREERHL